MRPVARTPLAALVLFAFPAILFPAACAPAETEADALARRIADASGGLAAWNALDVLRFDFVVLRDTAEAMRARHLWDRRANRYRVEWPAGRDSTVVAVFDPGTFNAEAPAGQAAINGAPLSGEALAARLAQGYRRFINDTYWLLAPLKTRDPGVTRALAPDSATADTEALALAFEGVGLTPGDRYWLHADRASGRLVAWTYLLQGDSVAVRWTWDDPAELPARRGALRLPARKTRADGAVTIRTDPRPAPSLADDLFTDLRPRL
ncbi:MAG: hypothetical protein ACK41D_07305 [Rubricoccaceae bacterium]